MTDSERCYASALRILQYRFNSEAELRRKLERKHFETSVVEDVIARLRVETWIDDQRFAGAFVRTRAAKKIGRLRIARELAAAGVDEESAARAVAENLDAELEREGMDDACRKRAAILVRRHGAEFLATAEARSKLASWLIARGYETSAVWDAVRSLTRRK